MDFALSDDQREIQALTRDFAQAEIEPQAAQWDRDHHFPRELYGKLAELGLMGVCVPEEYGGAGADFVSYILVLEELSRADAGVGVTVGVHTSAVTLPILRFGTDEQRARFVPALARGESIGAFALTEPTHGSDSVALETSARRDGEGWVLDGAKRWIGNGSIADVVVVWARDDADGQVKGFLVETGAPGFVAQTIEGKGAARAIWQAQLSLDGVRVPEASRLPGARTFKDA